MFKKTKNTKTYKKEKKIDKYINQLYIKWI